MKLNAIRRSCALLLALALLLTLTPQLSVVARAEEPQTAQKAVYGKLTQLVLPQYEDAKSFNEGRAAVKQNGKWGYIDQTGTLVVPCEYDFAGYFSGGVSVVAKLEATPPCMSMLERDVMERSLDNALAIFSYDTLDMYTFYLLKADGTTVPLYYYGPVDYDDDGNEIPAVPGREDLLWIDGEVPAEELETRCRYWGYSGGVVWAKYAYDLEGNLIWPEDKPDGYEQLGVAVDGYIPIVRSSMFLNPWTTDDGQDFCYMDPQGKSLHRSARSTFAPNQDIYPFNPMFQAWEYDEADDGLGFETESGEVLIPAQYASARLMDGGTFLSDNRIVLKDKNGKYGAYDQTGKLIVPFEYEFLSGYSEGFTAAKKDGHFVFLDVDGKEYPIGRPDGSVSSSITMASHFSSLGLAVVYDAELDKTYLVSCEPVDGVMPAVVCNRRLSKDAYFPDGTCDGTIIAPDEYIIKEQDGKYGYLKLELTEEPQLENPFDDVLDGQFYSEAVLWAVYHDPLITNGVDATHFAPGNTCTRAQVVTFLWRAQGCPEPKTQTHSFTDIKQGSYYYQAVLWAVENGITNGVSATSFGPDQNCTRAQVVTFLWRTAGKPEPASTEYPFTDVNGGYYHQAVLWAVENGITKGTAADRFSPDNVCTRAQVVTFLYRSTEH